MLDVTRFLNSNDIADYWRKIGFDKKCTPKQAAFIIWNSRKIPLKEKFEAWQQLIKTTIDCPVAAGRRRLNIGLSDAVSNSLHKFLGVYIALLKELIVEFYGVGDDAVYTYRAYCDGDKEWYSDRLIYRTADECFTAAESEFSQQPSVELQLKKQWLGTDRAIEIAVRTGRIIYHIQADGLPEEKLRLFQMFDYMWFNFPTPFKRGDIVTSQHSPFGWQIYGEEPFVLTELCLWGSNEYKLNGILDRDGLYARADRRLSQLEESGDFTDMTAHGYFQKEDGEVYYECMHNYLDLEYYRKKTDDYRRILVAISNFLKSETDVGLLLNACFTIMADEAYKKCRGKLSSFTKEGLRLAGIEVK